MGGYETSSNDAKEEMATTNKKKWCGCVELRLETYSKPIISCCMAGILWQTEETHTDIGTEKRESIRE